MGRKITDRNTFEEILLDAPYLRLALCDEGRPYIVPVSFGYRDGTIYLHSSRKGMKIDILGKNNKVCFETDAYYGLLPSDEPCSYFMKYRSVVGFGTASILEKEDEIKAGLSVVIERYHDKEYNIDDLDPGEVAIIRIDIQELHGREYGMHES
jgi:hypothetical protein